MAVPRHLDRAPITEALFDFRVKARPGLDVSHLREAASELRSAYPREEANHGVQYSIRLGAPPREPEARDLGVRGYFYWSADNRAIAQFRLDGYTFNRLAPYTSWDDLFPEALRLWTVYRSVAEPTAVIRLAVRYLNRIPIPPSIRDFDDYLTAPPSVPSELPQGISGFLTRITVPVPVSDIALNIGQSLEVDPVTRNVAVLIDIDVFDQGQRASDSPEIEAVFLRLRELKNRAFFSMITEATAEMFG